ncbi:unnamed protein product [Amoebophrya sp. A120]|nr:unnamed protein product [Amoebophrya sp. A120]|eukprot:GSA120T00011704001.1
MEVKAETENVWHQFAFSYDDSPSSGRNTVYVNGTQQITGSEAPNTPVGDDGAFTVGALPKVCNRDFGATGTCCPTEHSAVACLDPATDNRCELFMEGDIAQIAVYNVSLTSDQLTFLATSTTSTTTTTAAVTTEAKVTSGSAAATAENKSAAASSTLYSSKARVGVTFLALLWSLGI